jgi:hypothetical protein
VEHLEEREFNLRFSLEARFADDYEGDLDGFAWLPEWEKSLKPAIVRAVFDTIERNPAWRARVRNRGASTENEIEVVVERVLGPKP